MCCILVVQTLVLRMVACLVFFFTTKDIIEVGVSLSVFIKGNGLVYVLSVSKLDWSGTFLFIGVTQCYIKIKMTFW